MVFFPKKIEVSEFKFLELRILSSMELELQTSALRFSHNINLRRNIKATSTRAVIKIVNHHRIDPAKQNLKDHI
jgi:hypothetical protein